MAMRTSNTHQTDEQLGRQLQAGLDALDSGRFIELDDADLDADGLNKALFSKLYRCTRMRRHTAPLV